MSATDGNERFQNISSTTNGNSFRISNCNTVYINAFLTERKESCLGKINLCSGERENTVQKSQQEERKSKVHSIREQKNITCLRLNSQCRCPGVPAVRKNKETSNNSSKIQK
ncbi:hypothetical protein NPIL_308851 [Nephila pilipes]|uniref:Uncharacterized protein n=1 Tax=Nephila pilipes TaxID=299642 RepID=A0A8X6PEY0_NEPPI|nr:hypothetical protein NPIL_308851 [Nephila pilipes]